MKKIHWVLIGALGVAVWWSNRQTAPQGWASNSVFYPDDAATAKGPNRPGMMGSIDSSLPGNSEGRASANYGVNISGQW